jgi:hypothetical protein
VVEISTQNQKIEGSNFASGTEREKWVRSYLFVTSSNGTVAENLTHDANIKGLSPTTRSQCKKKAFTAKFTNFCKKIVFDPGKLFKPGLTNTSLVQNPVNYRHK